MKPRMKRKILVVDDAPMFRELGALFLGRSGRVITAENAAEALELAHRERPNVIVTDIQMPGMGGDELCREIRASPDLARTPVIALTGRDDGDEHERAVRAGVDDVIEKPLDRVSLIMAVNHYLRIATRGLARVPLETDVRVELDGGEAWAWSRNISRGGMFIELPERAFAPDTEVRLEFDLPDDDGIHLSPTAKVVWRRPSEMDDRSGMGLRFLKLDRDAARLLQDYVYVRAKPEDLADELAATT
jgi:uncharacterized protein (TIGR02266 family)